MFERTKHSSAFELPDKKPTDKKDFSGLDAEGVNALKEKIDATLPEESAWSMLARKLWGGPSDPTEELFMPCHCDEGEAFDDKDLKK